ncbi:MAG: hypothetical protein P4L35_07940 [Ignavibacteriaceae bacterium]|nr:hypothetical protein [Ignavibacteriaceae bacterium]
MVRLIFFSIALLLLSIRSINANTYYVDNVSGNNNNSGTSSSAAWNSISKVNSTNFKFEDTISFKAGSRFIITESLASKNNLTFNSYGPGARPIIDGVYSNDCVEFENANNVKFENLKFVNGFPSDISMWNCNNISFESCNIDSSIGNDIHNCNIYSGPGSNLTVRNCTLNYSEQGTDHNEGNLGIYIDGTTNTLMEYDTLTGNFSNIRIGFGLNTFTNGLIVRYCVLKNPKWDNVDDDGSAGALFYYNYFETSIINVYFFTDGSGDFEAYAAKNCAYYNNTFITHGGDGSIHLNSKTGINNGIEFKNNIFYSDNSAGYFLYEEVSGQMGSWTFTNNIYYMTTTSPHNWYRHGVTYNTLAQWQALGYDANSFYADPLFDNYATRDLSLKSGSKAISSGTNVGLTADLMGTAVPSNNPDMGAIQHNVGLLPVELISFCGSYLNNSVHFTWTTATEINNQGFDVERNSNSSWKKIGFVKGKGNSVIKNDYSFNDNNPVGNKIQYRLKQIDNNGNFRYSDVVNITITPEAFSIGNYPNPFNPSTKIRYTIPSESMINLEIYNIIGEKIDELKNEIQQPGTYEIRWSGDNHPSGIYLLSIIESPLNRSERISKTIKMNLIK